MDDDNYWLQVTCESLTIKVNSLYVVEKVITELFYVVLGGVFTFLSFIIGLGDVLLNSVPKLCYFALSLSLKSESPELN